MITSFDELNVSKDILTALEDMGFVCPTPVQAKVIPHILNRKDLIVVSKTGSGKTAAFGVPMLDLITLGAPGPQGLILSPTRELAVQVDSDLKLMSRHMQLRTTVVYGQHSQSVEIVELKRNPSIVTGTPGRVYDHIRQGTLHTGHVRFLVLDEADRMLDMGFIDQVVRIIKTLPRDRITLLFSATIPVEIRNICKAYMNHPITVEIESDTKTVDSITQLYYRVEAKEKLSHLNKLLIVEQPESCMIFCNTRHVVDRVQESLTRKGYASQALHGDIPQARRMKTIHQFKKGDFNILVATDVASRGIHVDDLSLVINYDVPNEKNNYVHRIGRTGRAGNGGRAITFASSDDIMSLYDIEEYIGAMIPEEDFPTEELINERKADAEIWIKSKTEFHATKHVEERIIKDRPSKSFRPDKSPRTPRFAKPKIQQKAEVQVQVQQPPKPRPIRSYSVTVNSKPE